MRHWQQGHWQQKVRLGVVAAASFVLLVLVLPQVATGIGLGRLAAQLTDSGSCGSGSGSSGSASLGGSGSGSSSVCGPPAISANPDTALVDDQSITVTGSGFPPYTQISLAECKAGATGQAGCDLGSVGYTGSDGSGSFVTTYAVSRIIETTSTSGSTESTDCAVESCILGGAESSNLAVAAVTSIAFNAKVPPVFQGALASTDQVHASTGVADIGGTFICRQRLSVQMFVYLDQHRGRFNVENGVLAVINCSGHKKWTVSVPPGFRLFGAGKATVAVALSTQIGNSYRNVELAGTVKLVSVTTK